MDISKLPGHLANFITNTRQVSLLPQLHSTLIGGKAGRPQEDYEVLNKSAIVLLVASWEAFIEDLATEAFDFLLQSADSPQAIPNKVLSSASTLFNSDETGLEMWSLCGDGWRAVLEKHKTEGEQ